MDFMKACYALCPRLKCVTNEEVMRELMTLTFFSDAALYVVQLARNIGCVNYYFSHFLFLKNSTHDPYFVHTVFTVELQLRVKLMIS
jgi:hypothetical protein